MKNSNDIVGNRTREIQVVFRRFKMTDTMSILKMDILGLMLGGSYKEMLVFRSLAFCQSKGLPSYIVA
jgi:hypothetical protein